MTHTPFTRPHVVDELAEAWRRRDDSPAAREALRTAPRWALPAERRAALQRVLDETRAALAIVTAECDLRDVVPHVDSDPVTARLQLLAELPEDQLRELHAAGLLAGLDLDEEP